MRGKTGYVFVVLVSLTWLLELGLGITLLRFYWGTAWYSGGAVGRWSIAETLASYGTGWTTEGVLWFWTWVFLAFYIYNAVWNGLLGPIRKRWRLGARRPSAREEEAFTKAYELIARSSIVGAEPISRPARWRVADGMGLQSRWIGYVLVIDRELIHHQFFPAILAHELGHNNSEDRLARRLYDMLPPTLLAAGIVGGLPFALGHALTYPFWAWYWRERIYDADAFAASCGQGHNLITALEFYQKLDKTTSGGRVLRAVPYVEQRIDRLMQLLAATP